MRRQKWRTIAIDATRRGFAFAVLEGTAGLLDWGLVRIPGENPDQRFLEKLDWLLERYHPRLLVVEDCRDTRRGARACRWIGMAIALAGRHEMSSATVTRRRVKAAFRAYGTTKHEIAKAIASHFPELAGRLPQKRKLWLPEPEGMGLFDALSFALAVLQELTPRG